MERENDIDSLARMVAEGFSNMEKRFDGVEERLENVEKEVRGINTRLDTVVVPTLDDHALRIKVLEEQAA